MAKIVGILLIVIGLTAAVWGGFTYTKREKLVDIGPIEATRTTERHIPIPPIVGVVTLVAGVVLVAVGRRASSS
jgi:hypothetical protein